jgi:hypothetical protein
MDPTACWKRILDAIEGNDKDEQIDACEDLAEWLSNKGFAPTIEPFELEFLLLWIADAIRRSTR